MVEDHGRERGALSLQGLLATRGYIHSACSKQVHPGRGRRSLAPTEACSVKLGEQPKGGKRNTKGFLIDEVPLTRMQWETLQTS